MMIHVHWCVYEGSKRKHHPPHVHLIYFVWVRAHRPQLRKREERRRRRDVEIIHLAGSRSRGRARLEIHKNYPQSHSASITLHPIYPRMNKRMQLLRISEFSNHETPYDNFVTHSLFQNVAARHLSSAFPDIFKFQTLFIFFSQT